MFRSCAAILVLFVIPSLALAEAGSLFARSTMASTRGSILPKATGAAMLRSSLFVGRADSGLFADPPAHEPAFEDAPIHRLGGADVIHIRHLIGQAESRRDGYDAVQHGARVRPAKQPTDMTLGEIFQWIEDTPGQPHAIGRYQFIPKTLARVVRKIGAGPEHRFSPQLQDRLADVLLAEAGLHKFRQGTLNRTAFMHNLAKIWAGLPTASGKSYYDGFAGNKASMTWARFDAEMARIAPG